MNMLRFAKILYHYVSTSSIQNGTYPWFLQHEAARSISTPPGRDASPSQVIPRNLLGVPNNLPIYTPGWRELGVLSKNTTLCSRPGLQLLGSLIQILTLVIPLLFQCVSTHVTFPALIKHRLCAQYLKVNVKELSRVIFSYKSPSN